MNALASLDASAPARPSGTSADPYAQATYLLAHVAVVIVGLDLKFAYGATVAVPVAVALLPLWVGRLRDFPLATSVVVLSLLAVASGWLLSQHAAIDHDVHELGRLQIFGLLLSGTATFVLVLWARSFVPTSRIVMLYGGGALGAALLAGQTSWKFDLAVPTTFVVLGLLETHRRTLLSVGAVVVLGVTSALDDGRSFFAICILAAALALWQMRPADPTRRVNRWLPALLSAVLVLVIYLLATALLTGGYLGTDAQLRSTEQIETSGSLIAGGRPEWAATRELVQLRPMGYGAGVVPSWEDVQAGRAGLQSVNVELESKRQAYMFGGQFKLHSIAADLWVSFGIVGLGLATVLAVGLVRSTSFAIAASQLQMSAAVAAALTAWFILFGPIYTNWAGVCFGVALVLSRRSAGPAALGTVRR